VQFRGNNLDQRLRFQQKTHFAQGFFAPADHKGLPVLQIKEHGEIPHGGIPDIYKRRVRVAEQAANLAEKQFPLAFLGARGLTKFKK
jgi:hypothetical protein